MLASPRAGFAGIDAADLATAPVSPDILAA